MDTGTEETHVMAEAAERTRANPAIRDLCDAVRGSVSLKKYEFCHCKCGKMRDVDGSDGILPSVSYAGCVMTRKQRRPAGQPRLHPPNPREIHVSRSGVMPQDDAIQRAD
ncbi:unnamed protein product [Angiostrongylus costaricensis]|uniref:SREBP regulating gene protein n=1 Tax=Angiostrongylus costaricensis TaxID=334426 RepID=A0A0R3PB98_ANGCS|nr:unnamed protein product [Angiostrongylus costaricensis]